jgi:hypothetical protein
LRERFFFSGTAGSSALESIAGRSETEISTSGSSVADTSTGGWIDTSEMIGPTSMISGGAISETDVTSDTGRTISIGRVVRATTGASSDIESTSARATGA